MQDQNTSASASNANAAGKSKSNSSLPLVDFISKWRSSNHNSEGELHSEITPNSPLLLNTNKSYVSSTSPLGGSTTALHRNELPDVPYPAPESFLIPGRVPPTHYAGYEDTDTDTEEDTDDEDDDEAQSIKSYSSDHIRTYDRLSLSRVTSSNSDYDHIKLKRPDNEIIDIPYLDADEYSSSSTKNTARSRGCFSKFSRLCRWSKSSQRAKSQESIELQERYSKSDNKSDSKKSKSRSKRSRYTYFIRDTYKPKYRPTVFNLAK